MRKTPQFLIILLISLTFSCKTYKQDILFNVDESAKLEESIYDVERNYRVQPNDLLFIRVFTNDGELAIDPNNELQNNPQNADNQQNRRNYLVQTDGRVKLPMVGMVQVANLTLVEAEDVLQELYNKFFKDSFVKLEFVNKRVIVLGHVNEVVTLENDNTSLLEVLSLAGGVNFGSLGHNIRIIRGDLRDPQVFMVDLTTITAMQNTIVSIEPGDIIYLEPWRRPWLEVLRDITPVLTLATSMITLAVLIGTL